MRFVFLISFLSLFLSVQSQDTISLPLNGTEIVLYRAGDKNAKLVMYNMHDNENTSALAGRVMAYKYGGEYYELIHNGKRNISIAFGKDSIHFDPNRIYTDAGVWAQLKRNKVTDTLAFKMIAAWRDQLLSLLHLEDRSLVIALHNNTNQNYGFRSYMPGEEYQYEAHALFKGNVRDKDDFYFVTEHAILHKLAQGKYHVILQDNETMTDDGSLSVYCGQLGIDYVNVEAQHGHIIRQIKMLMYVFLQLADKGL